MLRDSEFGTGALAVDAAVRGCNFNEIRLIPGLVDLLVARYSSRREFSLDCGGSGLKKLDVCTNRKKKGTTTHKSIIVELEIFLQGRVPVDERHLRLQGADEVV